MINSNDNVQVKNYYNNNKADFEKELAFGKALVKKEEMKKQILNQMTEKQSFLSSAQPKNF